MKSLIEAVIQVESGGDVNAEGDKGLPEHAYGCMQIRQPVCTDVNAKYGTILTPEQMLGWKYLSIAVFSLYMTIYANALALGRPVTDEDRARIWNGGPMAWKEGTPQYEATTGYWNEVSGVMNAS